MMTAAPRDLDPDDTSRCVIPFEATDCELCLGDRPDGRVGEQLEVVTARTDLGIACFVVCDVCALGPLPSIPIGAALRAVIAHAEHLGADVDAIAAAADAKDAR